MQKLLFGTQNKGKIFEVKALASSYDLEVLAPAELGLSKRSPEVEETAKTYQGNALLKAQAFCQWGAMPCFADDSGLEVEVLNGGPGLYSARFAGPDCSFEDNRKKMIKTLNQAGLESSPALLRSVICLVGLGEEPVYFSGILEGKVINQERGNSGFGYDPMFVPLGYDKTLAELKATKEESKTHRILAVEEMLFYFKKKNC
ncbi:MAG: non-canonical purine NTP pyrophosphatase [Bdellovibrionota bacterium]